jgi:hypothetical protein
MSVSLERIEWLNVGLVVVAVLVAEFTPWPDAWSVAAGGVMMAGNVWFMKGIMRRVLRPGGPGRLGVAMAMLLGKFALLLGLLGLLFWQVRLDGTSFALGISLFLVAAVVEAVRASVVNRGEQ